MNPLIRVFATKKRTPPIRRPVRTRLRMESLEAREVPTGGLTAGTSMLPIHSDEVLYDASTRTLTVYGTNERDRVEISAVAPTNPGQRFGTVVTLGRVTNVNGAATLTPSVTWGGANSPPVSRVRFYGYDASDQFVNDTAIPSVAYGGAGEDRLQGGRGKDTLFGGAGDDRLEGHEGNDRLDGGDGEDYPVGGNGHDIAWGRADPDLMEGSNGNDSLLGGDGDDHIKGMDGTDRLYGELGDDELLGGYGNNLLDGGADNDKLFGGMDAESLIGGAGNDHLDGSHGNDTLDGGAGNDSIEADLGNDLVYAGTGHDEVDTGAGNDRVFGQSGKDSIVGGSGKDTLDGGVGNDSLRGGIGDDTLEGDEGNDILHGDDGNDILKGQSGADHLYGDLGADFLFGGFDADTLVAIDGTGDVLYGGDASSTYGEHDNYWMDSTDALINQPTLMAFHVSPKVRHVVANYQGYWVGSLPVGVGLTPGIGDPIDPMAEAGDEVTKQNFAGNPLFGSAGPVYSDIDQGSVGDCYFLARLAALAQAYPQHLRDIVVDLGDGTYAVQFHNEEGNREFVRVDADLWVGESSKPMYANLGHEGSMWVAIIEKAWAIYRTGHADYGVLHGGNGPGISTIDALGLKAVYLKPLAASGLQLVSLLKASLDAGKAVSLAAPASISDDMPMVPANKAKGEHVFMVQSVVTNSQGVPVKVKLYNLKGGGLTEITNFDVLFYCSEITTALSPK